MFVGNTPPTAPPEAGVPELGPRRIGVLLLLSALFGSVSLVYPFGRDQASYAYSAWALLRGQMLYSDVFVFKPPMTSLVHLGAQLAFGHSMTSIRIADILWMAATGLVVARCAAHLFRNRDAALVAGALVPFFHFQMDWWNTAQTDGWMNLPSVLALWTVLEARRSTRPLAAHAFVAGALLGAAVLFKYVALAFVPGLLLAMLPRARKEMGGAVAAAAAGALLVLAICLGWLWVRGALDAFMDQQVNLIPGYVTATRTRDRLLGLSTYAARLVHDPAYRAHLMALPGLAVIAAALVRRQWTAGPVLAFVWLLGGAASYLAQGKYFHYHALALVPGLALVAAPGIVALASGVRRVVQAPLLRNVLTVVVPVLLLTNTAYSGAFARLYGVLRSGATLEEYWLGSDYAVPDYMLANSLAAAITVRKNTEPSDTIFVWGFDATIPFVAERRIASRFIYNYPFAVSWGNVGRYGPELMTALAEEPPTLFLVASHDAMPHVTGNPRDSRQLLDDFDELSQFLAAGYTPVAVVGRYSFYRRNRADLPG